MSENNVVDLFRIAAKQVQGQRRNVSWVYTYNRMTREWDYSVTVTLTPLVQRGTAASEADARAQVERMVKEFI